MLTRLEGTIARARWKAVSMTRKAIVCLLGLCSVFSLEEGYAADVTFRWDYSQSAAAGFALYCGAFPRDNSTRVDVGNAHTFTLPLEQGAVHFCSVTAYDSNGMESAFSNEIVVAVGEAPGAVSILPTLSVSEHGGVAPTATGVRVAFRVPFNPKWLNLFGSQEGGEGLADVSLVGSTTGPVRGSLVVDQASQGLTFIKTGGVLVPDTYTLTIAGQPGGLTDLLGRLLDGNGDGLTGDDYRLAFAVTPSDTPVLSIGEFARGPGQAVNLPATETTAGIPVRISNGAAVHDVFFTLRYNPALLSVKDVSLANSVAGNLTLKTIDALTGLVQIRVSNLSSLTNASTVLLRLQAEVPAQAPYRSQHVLDIDNLTFNAGALGGRDDDGLHIVAKLGDASGEGEYSATDSLLIQRVSVRLDSGFSAYPLTDPVVVGDVNDTGRVDATDALLVQYKTVRRPVPQIPDDGIPDTTAPTVAITTLPSGAAIFTNSSPLPLVGTAADNIGVTQVSWSNDRGGSGTASGTTNWAVGGGVVLQPGTNVLNVTARDAANNTRTTTLTVTYDLTPPVISLTVPSNDATVWGTTTLTASTSDNVGVVGVQFLVDGEALSGEQSGPSFSRSWATNSVPNGVHTLSARARDAAGNTALAATVSVAVSNAQFLGLAAAYSFEEGSGSTVADVSGNGNHGTLSNGVAWSTQGKYGSALVFNGSNALVTIPDSASLSLTAGMTLEAWVKPSTVSSAWRDVVYKADDNYYLSATSTAGTQLAAGGTFGQVYAPAPLTVNAWTHVAVTYDGVTLRLYVNGVQVSTAVRPGSIATSANPLQIGGDSLYGQYFQGMIDEVRVYNVARTPAQIQADANTPIGSVGLPVMRLAPSSLNFGRQQTNTTGEPQLVQLTNIGDASLTLDSIAILGAHSADFNQGNSCGPTLAAGTSCFISVTFTPRAGGARVATLTVSDNAPGSLHTLGLAGTGTTGVAINPAVAVLIPGQTQQFAASVSEVIWSVDGVVGGGPATGTITAGGLYTPPTNVGSHTVTATTSDQLLWGNSKVYISAYAGTFTYHNDNMRTGRNLNESVLTPDNVSMDSFGKLFSYQLDGVAHASPLYVAGVNIPGQGLRNVVYVVTEHNSVYAFDADGRTSTPLWHVSFIDPVAGVTTVPADDTGECCDISPEIGITSTPVIDPASGTLYVVAKTKEVSGGSTRYVQRLHALDIASGVERFGGPVQIQASVPGTGSGSQDGQLSFDPLRENQRSALLLSNGVVYLAFGSHGDTQPYHGWLLGYHGTTLQQLVVLCTTPNGEGGGVWMSNGGPAADTAGNIYFSTGDGTFDPTTQNYGDSLVKINPVGTVLDYFTPYDQASLDATDTDFGAGGVLLLPDQPGAHPHLALTAGKNAAIHSIDRDNLGRYTGSDSQAVQVLRNIFPFGWGPIPGNFSSPVYFNGSVYFSPVADAVKAFQLSNGLLSTTPTSQSPNLFPYRGGTLAISANGTDNGIVWAVEKKNDATPGALYAYDASNLAIELYNSNQAGTRDTLDVASTFSGAVVANGKVFVGTANKLIVYGLLP